MRVCPHSARWRHSVQCRVRQGQVGKKRGSSHHLSHASSPLAIVVCSVERCIVSYVGCQRCAWAGMIGSVFFLTACCDVLMSLLPLAGIFMPMDDSKGESKG